MNKDIAKKIFNIVLVLAVAVYLLVSCAKDNAISKKKAMDPVAYSEDISEGDHVYTDIVSMTPTYTIGIKGSSTSDYVCCACVTTTGDTVWVYMSNNTYKATFDSDSKVGTIYESTYGIFDNPETIIFDTDRRITGVIEKAKTVCKGLDKNIGMYVIRFEK